MAAAPDRRLLHTGSGFVMQNASLPQLQVLLAVARHRSFSGAARELGVSASAVRQSVKQLHMLSTGDRVVMRTRKR